MHRKYFIFILLLTLASIFFVIFSLQNSNKESVQEEYIIKPPRSPYPSYISGVGVVEPVSGNISIGTPVNRVIEKVLVKVGEKVAKGDILFELENRDLLADLRVQEVAYKGALAKVQKLEALPHPEDLASAKATMEIALAAQKEAQNQYEMVLNLPDPRAISQEEKERRRTQYVQAQEKYREAQAQFDKIRAGTWKPDLEIAHYESLLAKANTAAIETQIQRTVIRSPIDGTILQVKVHEGEFSQGNPQFPLMIIGDTSELVLRVSINQLEAPYFDPSSSAVAFLQGDAQVKFPLEFVRIEPLLVAKEEITSEVSEKVDTRVFQIIYKIMKKDSHVYVGARMDVFIDRPSHVPDEEK